MKEVTLSALAQDHPDLEVVFTVADAGDPAIPLVRAAMARTPARARLNVGGRPLGRNPKINNMAGAIAHVRGRFLLFTDSNTLLAPSCARRLQARALAVGGVVSAMPEGIEPRSVAAWTECAFLNQHHLRLTLTGDLLGFSAVHGKAMALSTEHLARVGGLEEMSLYPSDDIALMMLARERGIPIQLSDATVSVPLGRRRWRDVLDRQKRWAQIRWTVVPGVCLGELALSMIPAGALGMAAFGVAHLMSPMAFLVLHLSLWIGADLLVSRIRGQVVGPVTPLASVLRECVLLLILLTAAFNRKAVWRGYEYRAGFISRGMGL